MIETNPSSNATTVSIYLLRSFIVSNVRELFSYLEALKLCYYVLSFPFSFDHSFVRLSVCMYVINCCVTLCVKLSHLFLFSRKLN